MAVTVPDAVAIKRAAAADIPAVMRFIDEYWSRNHVLSESRVLMDWQYRDTTDPDRYNWLLAVDAGGTIDGVLGFIPTWRFDARLEADPVLWLALWKVRPAPANNGLGLALLAALAALKPGGVLAVQGINADHPPMYRALGFRVGELTHYFVCHPARSQTLASAPSGFEWPLPAPGRAVWEPASRPALAALHLESAEVPRKTSAYFAGRYFDHPFYEYRVFMIRMAGCGPAVVATRVAAHGSAKVLRIVDFAGDERCLSQSGQAIESLMDAEGCEYTDFWQNGLTDGSLEAAGFRAVVREGQVVVPNFFEPFLARNGRIQFAVKGAGDRPLRLFRGDGDQDRPNCLARPSAQGA